MTGAELTEWTAYYNLEPFGTDIHLLGHAITSSVVANVNRSKNSKTYEPEDFMPKFKQQTEQTVDDMILTARMYVEAFDGEDKTNE